MLIGRKGTKAGATKTTRAKTAAVPGARAQASSTTNVIEEWRGRITPSNFGRRKQRSNIFRDSTRITWGDSLWMSSAS